jgi:hypothetical protein
MSRSGVWAAAIAVIALGIYASSVALLPLNNNDVWIHLVTGGLVLDEGEVPTTDRYSFTAPGARYVAHEWLAGAIYAAAERAAGEPGVIAVAKLLPTLLILLLLGLVVRAARAPRELALPLALLAITVLRRRAIARPELMAAELLLLTLWLLWRDRSLARTAGRRSRAVFALIPIQIVWANVHGSFPIGVALAIGFPAVEWLEAQLGSEGARATLARRTLAGGAALAGMLLLFVEPHAFGRPAAALCLAFAGLIALDGREPILLRSESPAAPRLGRSLALAAAMAVACALNPRGFEIFLFPFEFTAGENVITGFVNEWRPLLASRHLEGSLFRASYSAFVGIGLVALAIALARRSVGLLELGLFAAFALLPLRHGRWMALSALCLVPVVASLLDAARARTSATSPLVRGASALIAALGAMLIALGLASVWADSTLRLVMAVAIVAGAIAPLLAWRGGALIVGSVAAAIGALLLGGLSIRAGIPDIVRGVRRPLIANPVMPARIMSREHRDAIAWLGERSARGRLFTEYEWAGYAIHELWPDVTVFIDSRSEVYGEALLARYVEMKKDPRAAGESLDAHGANLALIRSWPPPVPRFSPGLVEHLRRADDWRLVYFDDASLLFARGDALPPLLPAFEHFEPTRFPFPSKVMRNDAVFGDLGEARARSPQSGFVHMAYAGALDARGQSDLALEELALAWRLNPRVAWTAQLKGEIHLREGRRDEARQWFERAARARGSWQRPRQWLARVAAMERAEGRPADRVHSAP